MNKMKFSSSDTLYSLIKDIKKIWIEEGDKKCAEF